jgi:hypothetical protein
MATYNKFEGFVQYLATGTVNLHTDTLKVYLTNNAPSASGDDVVGDLAGITEENGYAAADVTNTCTETSGTSTVAVVDVEWEATGDLEEARYVVVFDDTHGSDILVCWWDYGSAFTVLEGETFTVDFTSLMTIA